jgi:hypothetical protein
MIGGVVSAPPDMAEKVWKVYKKACVDYPESGSVKAVCHGENCRVIENIVTPLNGHRQAACASVPSYTFDITMIWWYY